MSSAWKHRLSAARVVDVGQKSRRIVECAAGQAETLLSSVAQRLTLVPCCTSRLRRAHAQAIVCNYAALISRARRRGEAGSKGSRDADPLGLRRGETGT